jgi:molecular chaperone IbpA
MKYDIELAIAGFKKEDISIELKEHVLTIKGDREPRREQDKYVHKGISGRKFLKSFRLSEYAEVSGADLTDGILTVGIEVVLPEEKRPQMINITSNGVTNDKKKSKFLTG